MNALEMMIVAFAFVRPSEEVLVGYQGKAFEKHRFRPTYAGANVGHPSWHSRHHAYRRVRIGSKIRRSTAVVSHIPDFL
jgi:hypothetical protein